MSVGEPQPGAFLPTNTSRAAKQQFSEAMQQSQACAFAPFASFWSQEHYFRKPFLLLNYHVELGLKDTGIKSTLDISVFCT